MSQVYPGVRFFHVGYMDESGRFAGQTAKQIRQQNTKALKCIQSEKSCLHVNRHKKEVIV